MQFTQDVYLWLVNSQVIPNTGELDEKGTVTIPQNIVTSFENGYLIANIIRIIATNSNKIVPPSLTTIKAETSKNAKLTNWNFIWLAFDAIDLRMDPRIKQLILQGEQTLIAQVVRQLYQRDEHKARQTNKVTIKIKPSAKAKGNQIDLKKLNLSKNPHDSDTSLEFLVLLLNSSLEMSVQQILGLFTNQNKYLSQIIVKGVNDNFEPIILFFSLLIKHNARMRRFYEQDIHDAQACLSALKPGLISKSEKVVCLALEFFGKLENIYTWFVSQGGCLATFFMGMKRHPSIKDKFWKQLLLIIKGEEVEFFTKHFSNGFHDRIQLIQISTLLIDLLSRSDLGDKLLDIGVISAWLVISVALPESNLQAQIISFRFVGQLMLFMPSFIEQNEDSLQVFHRKWYEKSLPQFATLFNELMVILTKLGEERNSMASKIYQCVTLIAKNIQAGDKRDYLVQNFLPLVVKFPNIPTEYLIQHLKRTPLSNAEFLLVCQSIEINSSIKTLISIGTILKTLLFENPLLNFYISPILNQIIQKVIRDIEEGVPFVQKLIEQALHHHATLEVKYKSKQKHQSISFGKKDNSEKAHKENQNQIVFKQKSKQIVLGFILRSINQVAISEHQDLKNSIKAKLLNSNAYIKFNSFKVGCKPIEDALMKKFSVTKDEQNEYFEEYNKKTAAELTESAMKSQNKPISHVTVASRLKGPQNLTKEFQQIAQRRRQEEEQRKIQQLKKKANEQKKRLSIKKELEITSLLRGQIGQAQIRQQGFLERLIQEPKQIEAISTAEIEDRELQGISITLKKYHRVLRHLFLSYTGTMYNGHSNEKFEDNQQRKEILTIAQLVKMLKDYKLAFLTNQAQISGLVRDINIKLFSKRQLTELDFTGFEQFVIQYCALIMTKNHIITTISTEGKSKAQNNFKNEPLDVIVKEFFNYLKSVFIARREKVAVFQDEAQMAVSKEQAEQIKQYTKKIQNTPEYILPKGYKKIAENTIKFNYEISRKISGIPESYIAVMEILDEIFSQDIFKFHTIENISQKKTVFKVKLSSLGNPSVIQKERAMSTYIEKKSLAISKDNKDRRSSTRGILAGLQKLPATQRNLGEQAAAALGDIIDKVEAEKDKIKIRQRKIQSMSKLQEIDKRNKEALLKKAQEKEQQKQALIQKEKEEQQKRRQRTLRFLDEQRVKLAEKKRKEEEEKLKKVQQQEYKQAQKRQNKQKFKVFHQNQVQKIKKIQESALEKIRKQRIQLQQTKEQKQEQRRKLKEQIEQQDRRIIQIRKQNQAKIQNLYESQPIRKIFSKYEPNIKAVFDFLIHNTYVSLTQKRHNNEIIFETWRQFLTTFELTAIIHPKDITFIFKSLTKGKLASKDYYIGLNFGQFQQALLRIAIKYKAVFNLISEKIKDNVGEVSKVEIKKEEKKGKKEEQNQFQNINDGSIKEIIKENILNKDSMQEYGDISQVTDKTLLGVIYYLKVPKSKQGQEKRFRQILAAKHSSFSHQSQRLKEKLKEEYTLEEPKKTNQSKNLQQKGITPQVSAK